GYRQSFDSSDQRHRGRQRGRVGTGEIQPGPGHQFHPRDTRRRPGRTATRSRQRRQPGRRRRHTGPDLDPQQHCQRRSRRWSADGDRRAHQVETEPVI
ncbi:hypothetical protein, partial [Pseudomonas sp. FEN]